jgi:hypothetical protein
MKLDFPPLELRNAPLWLGGLTILATSWRTVLAERRFFSGKALRAITAGALGLVSIVAAMRTLETLGLRGLAMMAKIGVIPATRETVILPRARTILGKPRDFLWTRGFLHPGGLKAFQQIHFQTGKVLGLIFLTHN